MRQVKGKTASGSARGGKTPARGANARKGEPARKTPFLLQRPVLGLTLGLILVVVFVGVFAGGYVSHAIGRAEAAVVAPFTEAGFAVREVTITGEEHTTEAAAASAVAVPKGESIFGVSPDQARARLLMLPWVADAEVRRHFPDKVSVHLIEKRPFALWRDGNALMVVERSGAVITKAEEENHLGRLPLLAGAGAPEAAAPIIDALAGQKATQARLVALQRVAGRRWDLLLSGGVTVRLPEDGWERQLTELEKLIVEKGVLERDIESIDLRYPDNYVFRLRNGDSRPVPRERRA